MDNKFKKPLCAAAITVGILYIIFLASPIAVTPILSNYEQKIADTIKTSTGYNAQIEKLSFTTSWNLRAGIKADKFALTIPSKENPFFYSENIKGNIALIPLLFKKIQLGSLSAQKLNTDIEVKKDGSLLVLDYLPKNDEPAEKPFVLPFGLKLSNRMPDIKLNNYKLTVSDMNSDKTYYTEGENFTVTKFILDKRIKLKTNGKIVLDDNKVSEYNINLDNRIMPDIKLQDIVFPEKTTSPEKTTIAETPAFNIIDFLNAIVKNQFCGNITTDIKTAGTLKSPEINGSINAEGLSVAVDGEKLPESYISLQFKGAQTSIDSILFSAPEKEEQTQIIGNITTGKKPAVDITLRSNAKFNNIIKLVNSIAKSFSINDFETLSATGGIDADFNINSDLKKVSSNGYLKVLPSKISYGLYNIVIDNITADIALDNGITINKSGFSIFSHPLTLTGTINHDAATDLTLNADKISIKGLLAALGQVNLLKDNEISGGNISLKAYIKGKLNCLKPEIVSSLENLKLYNKPSALNLALANLKLNADYDGKILAGDMNITDLSAKTGNTTIKIPDTNILLDSKDVSVKHSYLLLNNSRIDITGGIKNYINDKMAINLSANGDLQSSDIISFLPKEFVSLISYKGSLPLSIKITGNSKIQNISFCLDADKDNYVSLIDIDKIKNKPSKIKSTVEIIGDTLTFRNTGFFEESNLLAELSGGITKLYSKPKLNMNIIIPNQISFPIWGISNSNISVLGSADISGKIENPYLKGKVMMSDISMKDMDVAIKDLTVDLDGEFLNGTADAKEIKSGGLAAKEVSGKLSLNNYSKINLTDLSGTAFDGKVTGKLSYDINTAKINLDFTGEGLNASNAIYGAAGIKDALTGTLNFKAALNMQGIAYEDIVNSLAGDITFDIQNGRFVSIGKLENLVAAQNISSNSILKSAVSALSVASTVQEANKFKTISGDIKMADGSANLNKILVAGPLMSYYVTGVYNILPNTANIIILGRLDESVVSVLGVVGELSVDKLLSSIPKLGTMSAAIWKQLTLNSASEDTSQIPALTNGSTSYKDFKVSYNGVVGAASSVKYFKWLASTIETPVDINIKQDLQNAKEAVKENITTRVENAKNTAETVKTNIDTKIQTIKENAAQAKENFNNREENLKSTSDNIKNLLKNAIKNSLSKPAASPEAEPETAAPADTTTAPADATTAE